jgi:hypothetical protein
MSDPRPCERKCKNCGEWKHHSRFRFKTGGHSTVTPQFKSICKACEQKLRNAKKNADRPRAIIEQRAATAATKAGTSREFFWIEMNYQSLVPVLRALMTEEALCNGCGHKFLHERDIQIEHLEAPRSRQDWARLHTRNVRLFCASCNNGKKRKPFAHWLDEQEDVRLSNLQQAGMPSAASSSTRTRRDGDLLVWAGLELREATNGR